MKQLITAIALIGFFFFFSPLVFAQAGGACTCGVTGTISGYTPLIEVTSNNCLVSFFPRCSGGVSTHGSNLSCNCEAEQPGVNCTPTGQPITSYASAPCCSGFTTTAGYNWICQAHSIVVPASPTPYVFNMCNGLTGDEWTKCDNCLRSTDDHSSVYTAIGCIKSNPKEFIADFLTIAMGIAGGIAFLLMIYGVFLITTSAGDPKKADEGKEVITGTIAGLLFIIFSVMLLKVIGVDILQIPGF